ELQDMIREMDTSEGLQRLIDSAEDRKSILSLVEKKHKKLMEETKNGQKLPEDEVEALRVSKDLAKYKTMVDLLKAGTRGSWSVIKDTVEALIDVAQTVEDVRAIINVVSEGGAPALYAGFSDSLSSYWKEYQ